MSTNPRYYIAERPDRIAILDRTIMPAPPAELARETPGVCRFWDADYVTGYCECGRPRGGHWEIKQYLRAEVAATCERMNRHAEKHAEATP
jgi:hypothetical protein